MRLMPSLVSLFPNLDVIASKNYSKSISGLKGLDELNKYPSFSNSAIILKMVGFF